MRTLALPAITLALTGLTAPTFAGEITSLDAGIIFLDGSTSRGTQIGSFDQDTTIFAHGVYTDGALTFFGGIETQNSEFSDTTETLYLDAGVEYRFGTYGIGGQLAHADLKNLDSTDDLDSTIASLYGIYATEGLEAGAGVYTVETSDNIFETKDSDRGMLGFATYDATPNLTLGGQFLIGGDSEDLLLYADFSKDRWGISFDLINQTGRFTSQFVELKGSYEISGPVSALASVRTIDTNNGDSTTEIALGAEYAFGNGIALQAQYVEFDAFNSFQGNGISLGLVYELGTKRKSGYQPLGKTLAKYASPVFFTF